MRPQGRAATDRTNPRAHAVCDRCGFRYNHYQLQWQFDWAGTKLQNKRILVCHACLDRPQEQLRTIMLPADPVPIQNPRPEQYSVEVNSYLVTAGSSGILIAEDGDPLITEINLTPTPTSSGFSTPASS